AHALVRPAAPHQRSLLRPRRGAARPPRDRHHRRERRRQDHCRRGARVALVRRSGRAVLVLREKDGAGAVSPVSEKARRALRGAQLGSVLVDRHLFGLASRYSRRFEATEKDARALRRKMEAGEATAEDRKAFLRALHKLEELTAKEEERWAKAPV